MEKGKVTVAWLGERGLCAAFEKIDSEFEALRQEIQDLKGKDMAPETNLRREITVTAKDLFDNRLGWSEGRNPYAPRKFWIELGIALYGENSLQVKDLKKEKPEPDLQCGDFVSYIATADVPHRKKGDKVWGIFQHQDSCNIWGYFQQSNGNFNKCLGWMPRDEVTFEFRPKK